MKPKEFLRLPATERILKIADADNAALARRIADCVRRYKVFVARKQAAQMKKWGHIRWPFRLTVSEREINVLVEYLFKARATGVHWPQQVAPIQKRPLPPGRKPVILPVEPDPETAGEEFCILLRRYWQLMFGFSDGKTEVHGLGRLIFDNNEVDPLDVWLQLGDFHDKTHEQIARDLKPVVMGVSRNPAPTVRTLAGTVRQRLRDLQKPRLK